MSITGLLSSGTFGDGTTVWVGLAVTSDEVEGDGVAIVFTNGFHGYSCSETVRDRRIRQTRAAAL